MNNAINHIQGSEFFMRVEIQMKKKLNLAINDKGKENFKKNIVKSEM